MANCRFYGRYMCGSGRTAVHNYRVRGKNPLALGLSKDERNFPVPTEVLAMKQPDDLSAYYEELLEGRYDCVDRIVLNGYFPLGQQGGAFRPSPSKAPRLFPRLRLGKEVLLRRTAEN